MHPEKLGIEPSDWEALQKDKFTQTSVLSLSSKPKEIIKTDKGSITVFEFCQIIQDPENPGSVTIVKESVTEETRNHPTNSSVEDNTANRYRYCKEVIKPYLKFRPDCSKSEEVLLKEALDSAGIDFPDYHPCYEVVEENKDIPETKNVSNISSISKVDALTSYSSMDGKEGRCPPKKSAEAPKCPPRDNECNPPESKLCPSPHKPDSAEQSCPRPKSPCPPLPPCPPKEPETSSKPKCVKKKSTESVGKPKCAKKKSSESVSKPKCEKKKSSASACKSKCSSKENLNCCDKEPTIGIVGGSNQNPVYIATERCIDKDNPMALNRGGSTKTFAEAHNETVSVIKVAMEDFIGKAYRTTQDAVCLIATESAKQLLKQKASEAVNTDIQKTNDSKSSETVTKFNFFRKTESRDSHDIGTDGPHGPTGTELIGNILTKVDSAITLLGEKLSKSFENFPECMMSKSSPLDKPKPKPPSDVSHVFLPEPAPASQSVFSAIKSKIYSIFSDVEPKLQDSLSSSTISSRQEDESDDNNLMDKLIE